MFHSLFRNSLQLQMSLVSHISNQLLQSFFRKPAPAPPTASMMGHLGQIYKDPLSFFAKTQHEYGDTFRFRSGPYLCYFIAHPNDIKHVLQDAQKDYTKDAYGFDKTPLLFRSGILLAEGANWLNKRRAAQPAFSQKELNLVAPQMLEVTDRVSSTWPSGQPVHMGLELSAISLQIFFQTMLGIELEGIEDQISEDVSFIVEDLYHRSFSLVDLPLQFPAPRNLVFRKRMKRLLALSKQSLVSNSDLQAPLIKSWIHDQNMPFDDSLVDEALNFFLAGHETTANTLFWALYVLSQRPELEEEVLEESVNFFNHPPSSAEWNNSLILKQFPRTKQIIFETLRLYPSVWAMGRAPLADDQLGGYFIPKGSTVVISPWITHRHPDFWDEPDEFKPERFSSPNLRKIDKFAYLPFGNGPRRCIGEHFAMIETVLVLATLIRNWRFEKIYPIDPLPRITLQTKQSPFLIPYKREIN